MRVKDVPQDNDVTYEGEKKLCYALDDEGRFVATTTNGWSVEATVKSLAWKKIEDDLQATSRRLLTGQASTLEYFMKLRQMDPSLLAQNMNISIWRVRWHLRPRVFEKLKPSFLMLYADCLDIPVETLRSFRGNTKLNL